MQLDPPASFVLGKFEVYESRSDTWLKVVLCHEEQSLGEEFSTIAPVVKRALVDDEHNTWPYPSWMLIFSENYQPRHPGTKDAAVLGYVAGAASIGDGFEGFKIRFVQRVVVVSTIREDYVVPRPSPAQMHGQLLNNTPWFIG